MDNNISKEEKEKIRLKVLSALDGEVFKHSKHDGGFFYSDSKNSNPDSLHNRVIRNMEP